MNNTPMKKLRKKKLPRKMNNTINNVAFNGEFPPSAVVSSGPTATSFDSTA
jgi:hypothetical protein